MDVDRLGVLSDVEWSPESVCLPVCNPVSPEKLMTIDLKKWMGDQSVCDNDIELNQVTQCVVCYMFSFVLIKMHCGFAA